MDEYISNSLSITALLLTQISDLIGNKPKFIVNCSENVNPDIKGKWKKLADDAGFAVMKQPSLFVEKIQRKRLGLDAPVPSHAALTRDEMFAFIPKRLVPQQKRKIKH